MKKLIITKIDGFNYYFDDGSVKNIEFYRVININPGISIEFKKSLLNESMLSFEVSDEKDFDAILNGKIYLKRVYG